MQKLLLASLALCSLINSLQAELIYAAVSGLPPSFLPFPPPAGNALQELRPPPMHDANLARSQRSLYGPAFNSWQGPPVQPHSIGLGHISKQELITLLEAAKEVAKPAPEPEPEAEPEPEPEQAQAPAAAGGSAGGPPAGVPLTVSLPAFVPIQLSAMYTAPPPAAAPGGQGAAAAPGAAEGGGEEETEEEEAEDEEEEEEEEEEDEEEEAEPEPAPAPIKPYYPIYHPWSSRAAFGRRVVPYEGSTTKASRVSGKAAKTKSKSGSKSKTRKSKSRKSKARSKKRTSRKPLSSSKPNLRFAGSAQNFQALPPPPFLSRAPGPLKLVPSNQLLSNWNSS